MSIKEKLNTDLKQAMLAGDKARAETIRGLKSAILYAEVAGSNREDGLSDEKAVAVLAKEAKKRQESIDAYQQSGNHEQAEAEQAEKVIIDGYLPEQVSEEELKAMVEKACESYNELSMRDMGEIIGKIKAQAGPGADGSLVARLVKERINT
jgi:uncharacterized protein YqeY